MSKRTPALPTRFLRVADVRDYAGLTRSVVYRLLADGSIRSVSLRQPGMARGVRLVDRESLDRFLDRCE